MSEGDGGSSMYGVFASKIGSGAAKAGKKFAQSEAGRSATRAAMKGATDAAVNDISNRYLGPEPTPSPTKPTTPSAPPTSSSKSATPSSNPAPPTQTTPTNKSDDDYETHRNESYQWTRPPPKPSLLARFKPNINLKLQSDEKSKPRPRRVNKDRVFKYAAIDKADWDSLPRAMTLYNFHAEMKCDLEFRKGQVINVMTKSDSTNDWWEGRIDDRVGLFPANYVKMI